MLIILTFSIHKFSEIIFFKVLDEFSDPTSKEERFAVFHQMSTDEIEPIDFEEFLTAVSKLLSLEGEIDDESASNFHHLCVKGAVQVKKIRRMSIYKQLTNGVFWFVAVVCSNFLVSVWIEILEFHKCFKKLWSFNFYCLFVIRFSLLQKILNY